MREWLDELVRGIADSGSRDTHSWTANKIGCLFVFLVAISPLLCLKVALGGNRGRLPGWWVCGGPVAIGLLGLAALYWISRRLRD